MNNSINSTVFSVLPSGLLPDEASPAWLNKGDNAWQLSATTMVGLQSVPGLVIIYGSIVKRKWAINSAFMALYAFAAVLLCWVLWAHQMSFGPRKMGPLVGRPGFALSEKFLVGPSTLGSVPMADYVYFQFVFAAITVILLGGSLLGRMNFYAWMMFVPLWLTFSYTVGAFSVWGNGFLERYIIDYAGGYVIHLSSGVAGFTAAYWVGPRLSHDKKHFPPNNIIHMLGGAGFLWMGWSGFNGGSPFAANLVASLAILNTHICTATSLMVWISLDMIVHKKSSVVGAVQGMMTGLVCITPGAGIVSPWAAVPMGVLAGSVPWYTMMVLHKRWSFFQNVDDTLGVFHTHAVAGVLGGLLSGALARPNLLKMMYGNDKKYAIVVRGGILGVLEQLVWQIAGAVFVTVWNAVMTSIVCIGIRRVVSLRMSEEDLEIGDDAVHGEEVYALWGDGEKMPNSYRPRWQMAPRIPSMCNRQY